MMYIFIAHSLNQLKQPIPVILLYCDTMLFLLFPVPGSNEHD